MVFQVRLRWVLCMVLVCVGTIRAQELRRSGFLGVLVVPLSDAARQRTRLPAATGVEVQRLVDGGSARAAGVEVGDVITRIEGHDVAGPDDFVASAKRLRAGDVASLSVIRGEQTRTIRLEVLPRPVEKSPDADVRYLAVEVDGSLRRVIVTLPKQPGRYPALLFMTGIGCFSQESLDRSTTEAALLYGLTARGFVTMRVEKSGMGDSEGPPCSSDAAGLRSEVRAYLAGLKALKQYPFVDPSDVFLIGHSIGGVEAPMVARQESVRGIVVVNTVAKPFLEYLLETRRRQGQLRHAPFDEIDRENRLDEWCNHRLVIDRQAADQVNKENPACREHIEYPAPSAFMQEWAAVNPAEEWKPVTSPVLAVYGTSDYVATGADHPYLATMLNTFHPGQATVKAIEGMDHNLARAESMEASRTRPPGTPLELAPTVLDVIGAWLGGQVAVARSSGSSQFSDFDQATSFGACRARVAMHCALSSRLCAIARSVPGVGWELTATDAAWRSDGSQIAATAAIGPPRPDPVVD